MQPCGAEYRGSTAWGRRLVLLVMNPCCWELISGSTNLLYARLLPLHTGRSSEEELAALIHTHEQYLRESLMEAAHTFSIHACAHNYLLPTGEPSTSGRSSEEELAALVHTLSHALMHVLKPLIYAFIHFFVLSTGEPSTSGRSSEEELTALVRTHNQYLKESLGGLLLPVSSKPPAGVVLSTERCALFFYGLLYACMCVMCVHEQYLKESLGGLLLPVSSKPPGRVVLSTQRCAGVCL